MNIGVIQIARIIEQPTYAIEIVVHLYKSVGKIEAWFCDIDIVPPEFEISSIPTHIRQVYQSLSIKTGIGFPFPDFPILCNVDRGARHPLAPAISLARSTSPAGRGSNLHVRKRTQAGGQKVQLLYAFPGLVDHVAQVATQFSTVLDATLVEWRRERGWELSSMNTLRRS